MYLLSGLGQGRNKRHWWADINAIKRNVNFTRIPGVTSPTIYWFSWRTISASCGRSTSFLTLPAGYSTPWTLNSIHPSPFDIWLVDLIHLFQLTNYYFAVSFVRKWQSRILHLLIWSGKSSLHAFHRSNKGRRTKKQMLLPSLHCFQSTFLTNLWT